MSDSYHGGSTVIYTRTKGWWKGKRKRAKKNNEKHNDSLRREVNQRELTASWEPQFTLIKAEDYKPRR